MSTKYFDARKVLKVNAGRFFFIIILTTTINPSSDVSQTVIISLILKVLKVYPSTNIHMFIASHPVPPENSSRQEIP